MNCIIRKIKQSEIQVLSDFLYEAIFIPVGAIPPPREIIKQPELQIYISDFGKCDDDICYVAEVDGNIIGAVWVRIMDDYGYVDDETPSFAISLNKGYRLALMLCTLLREERIFRFDLNFFHDFG